jgi:acetylornithine deacetylase/succinyl-diaminopimelate desuccinylase-like protein
MADGRIADSMNVLAASVLAAALSTGAIDSWVKANRQAVLDELTALLSIPNVASDTANIERNAELLQKMLQLRGAKTSLLRVEGAPPAVFGEITTPGATRTLVFYAHYDGQPVVASDWATDPWKPVIRDDHIYARSASDDKGPIVAMLAAIDALRASRIPLKSNLKFFLEGEEEAGSPHLRQILEKHAALLDGDLWIFGDGPVHQSRRMQVYYGVRGVTGMELTIYGPSRALHSGHYGNWAPNPAALLANALASMRDSDGRILIAGFDDDVRPLTEREKGAIAAVPAVDEDLRRELALGGSEAGNAPIAERINRPAMNIRGIRAGAVGSQASNAIPTSATASVDFRLVPGQTPARVREKVERHLRSLGYHLTSSEPTVEERRSHPRVARLQWDEGYPAARTSMDLPIARSAVAAIGGDIIELPTLGGSLPIYIFEEVLHAPLIGVPIVNHDNSQHAANENLRLQNLWDGIRVYAALLAGME